MRLGILADIHGNLPALEAVIADMADRRLDAVVNLGDCVSGPLWPRETLALLRKRDWPTVRGNHDRLVGEGAPDRLGPSDRFAHDAIDAAGRAWLADLPGDLTLEHGVVAFHARPGDDDTYLLEEQWGGTLVRSTPESVRRRLGPLNAAIVLTAHSHQQNSLALPDGPLIVNPGSVGCPAYESEASDPPHVSEQGSPAARYAVLAIASGGVSVEALAIPYACDRAAERAAANSRPEWAHALRTGFMPRRSR